jgi:antirestriction protein ArdC
MRFSKHSEINRKSFGKKMARDLYSEISARIAAELENGAAPWVKPWSAMPGQNTPHNAATGRPYSGCNIVSAVDRDGKRRMVSAALPDFQASARPWRQRAQRRARDQSLFRETNSGPRNRDAPEPIEGAADDVRTVGMLREYTVFNVAQCENLPARVTSPEAKPARDHDGRDETADEFCAPAAPTFAKARAKPSMCQAATT